ncbi:MAG: hypothetical protein JST39_05940 [Bacteroidetes bacterium]|nr:hypothetical protein [Bacteroidota bacterium]
MKIAVVIACYMKLLEKGLKHPLLNFPRIAHATELRATCLNILILYLSRNYITNTLTMEIQLIHHPLKLHVFGFGGIAVNKNYAATAFGLMDKVWPVIKSKGLKHKGLNTWIYEAEDKVFAGVELEDSTAADTGLEQKIVLLDKYAYIKHIGPYSLIKQTSNYMQNEIRKMGLTPALPYIEIYGHWTEDESRLETELLLAIG